MSVVLPRFVTYADKVFNSGTRKHRRKFKYNIRKKLQCQSMELQMKLTKKDGRDKLWKRRKKVQYFLLELITWSDLIFD